jgi:hypothetical protein
LHTGHAHRITVDHGRTGDAASHTTVAGPATHPNVRRGTRVAEHDEQTVIARLRDQLRAVENYARRLEKAAECGIVPEGWRDPCDAAEAAAEIRRLLREPHQMHPTAYVRGC